MKLASSNRLLLAIFALFALAVMFWMFALSPKREQAKKLGTEVQSLQASLAQHQAEADEAEAARDEFAANYRQLIVLGKAVPGDDDTASLLVQLNRIAAHAGAKFNVFSLSTDGAGAVPPAPATAEPAPAAGTEPGGTTASAELSPTEAVASTLPLGAQIGPAGLAVMPYSLTFEGEFFEIADFIKGLDSLVKTENQKVAVTGRLLTIDGFSLTADSNKGFPLLTATFSVSTYLTPPEQGVTGGASSTSPPGVTPVSTPIGGTP